MPLVPIKLRPGIDTVQTPTLNEGGFTASTNIRFYDGLPQKGGGYINFTNVLSGAGAPNALRPWTALTGISYLAIGCSRRLNLFASGTVYDITPNTFIATLPMSIMTTAGSTTIQINDPIDTPSVGEAIHLGAPVTVGGIVLYGTYLVTGTGSGYYTIAAQSAAVTSGTGGGTRIFSTAAGSQAVTVAFANHGLFNGQIVVIEGPVSIPGSGVTLSGYYIATVISPNVYTIQASTAAAAAAMFTENQGRLVVQFLQSGGGAVQNDLYAATYSLDNWGEFLMSVNRGGPLAVWQPSNSTSTPSSFVTTAPLSNNAMFVASQQQTVFTLGTLDRISGKFNPMLVRFSDVGDYTSYTPTATNQAGSFLLTLGSELRAGIALPGQNLIWSDTSLYTVQYLGFPLVWGFQPLGTNCGCDGPHALGTLSGQLFWKNRNQFMTMGSGAPDILPCPVWDDVFANQDTANLRNVTCKTNAFWNEISWSVPQIGGGSVMATLKVTQGEPPQWTVQPEVTPELAWADQNAFGAPLGGQTSGAIVQHESGVDAAGTALSTSLTTGRIKLAEGDQYARVQGVYPDIKWLKAGTLSLQGFFYDNPNKPPRATAVYTITPTTQFVGLRGRGRDLSFQLTGNDTGSNWRLGLFRYFGEPDGHGP